MGQCGGKSNLSEEEKLRIQRDQSINKDLAETAQIEAAKIKLLLLGAGESGKSTIFKQMKVIYGKKYTEEEKRYCIPIIFFNIITSMKILCQQAIQQNLLPQVHAINEFDLIRNLDENSSIDLEVGNAIKCLWEDPGIQEVWKLRSQFHIIESVQYYFNRIDIIKLPDYLPDKDDILYYRIRTSGIVTESYSIDKRIFEMYDVGGQRNERKKWIHCFEDVTAIIFVVALSEYDQQLFEDKSVNRMTEALDLFEEIVNNVFFRKSSIILFLNKRDLFEEKVLKVPIQSIPDFADYSGPPVNPQAGIDYFLRKLLERNKSLTGHQIYHHVTCATDTRNIRAVFDASRDIILKANLRNSGFLDED